MGLIEVLNRNTVPGATDGAGEPVLYGEGDLGTPGVSRTSESERADAVG